MSKITELTAETFEKEVIESAQPVLVDFYGHHCSACVQMLPLLEEVAQEKKGRVKVVKLNAHDNLEIASRFRVNAIPNFVLISNGAPLGQRVGRTPKAELSRWIDDTLR